LSITASRRLTQITTQSHLHRLTARVNFLAMPFILCKTGDLPIILDLRGTLHLSQQSSCSETVTTNCMQQKRSLFI